MIRHPPSLGEALERLKAEAEGRAQVIAHQAATDPTHLGLRRPAPPDIGARKPRLVLTVPVRTANPTNGRFWKERYRLAKEQREAVAAAFLQATNEGRVTEADRLAFAAGCSVRMARISSGELDSDAVPAALKTVRDSTAQWLLGGRAGERDNDPRVEWAYSQVKAKRGIWAVMIILEKIA